MISLILVMVCAIAAGWLANRIYVPYPVVLVLAGIGLGFVHDWDWPGLQLEPHLMLAIVLPEAVAVKRFFNSPSLHRSGGSTSLDSETRLWLAAAAAQRDALIKLWREDKIGDDVLIRLEREIDLAEARLARED